MHISETADSFSKRITSFRLLILFHDESALAFCLDLTVAREAKKKIKKSKRTISVALVDFYLRRFNIPAGFMFYSLLSPSPCKKCMAFAHRWHWDTTKFVRTWDRRTRTNSCWDVVWAIAIWSQALRWGKYPQFKLFFEYLCNLRNFRKLREIGFTGLPIIFLKLCNLRKPRAVSKITRI